MDVIPILLNAAHRSDDMQPHFALKRHSLAALIYKCK